MSASERLRRALGQQALPAPPPAAAPPVASLPALPGSAEAAGAVAARQRRLEQLRREVERIGRRFSSLGGAHPFTPLHDEGRGGLERLLSEAARARRELPPTVDAEGLLYRSRIAVGERIGRYPLPRAEAGLLNSLARLRQLQGLTAQADGRSAETAAEGAAIIPELGAEEILFLDLETTGLSRGAGTLAFVIGLGFFDQEGGLVLEQILLRDPALEPAALALLEQRLARARLLVTYNGRGFDVPVLRNRAVLCRVPLALEREHLDLLPVCRQLFRHRLPSCRLQSVERELLGLERVGDLDGAEAPAAYSRYLAGGSTEDLLRVLEHNRLDVAVLAGLLWSTSLRAGDPLHWAEDAEELLALGLQQLRRGSWELGEACLGRGLELARAPLTRRRLLAALARQLRRRGRRQEASRLWERHCQEFPDHCAGWIELAKYHEHVTRDLPQALALLERAPAGELEAWQRRRSRLRRRLGLEASSRSLHSD